jgi:SAM-dependent methyltransferase
VDDIGRLRIEYARRKRQLVGNDLYSLFNVAYLYAIQQRQRIVLSTLKKNGFINLSKLLIAEIGCGNGSVLTEYLGFGAVLENVYGVDLLFDRLTHARHVLYGAGIANADGQNLPFPSHSFDLVIQSMAISSILDSQIRRNVCFDMLRVLKPTGMILWYDFWLNPTNPQTQGVRPSELRLLFPMCTFEFHKITLAPPLARIVVPISWGIASLLEKLKIFNTHYLVAIHPNYRAY